MRIKKKEDYIFGFNSIDEIRKNVDFYSSILDNFGLLCLRGANFSDQESLEVLSVISTNFSWTPFPSDGKKSWKYTQNYDGRILSDAKYKRGSRNIEKLINSWHTEGVPMRHQQLAAGWNMRHFRCHESEGRTGFVDSSEIIKQMPENMLEFLNRSKVIHYPSLNHGRPDSIKDFCNSFISSARNLDDVIWSKDGLVEKASFPRDAISIHPSRGVNALRLCPCTEEWGAQDILYSVNGEAPSDSDYEFFIEVMNWLYKMVDSHENQWWHEWNEGDFVIPDLFVMIHSAETGFDVGEREFDGFWCYPNESPSEPDCVRVAH